VRYGFPNLRGTFYDERKNSLYETEVEWTGAKDLKLRGAKQPTIAAGAPAGVPGREENWSPEHLLVASLNSCQVLTLIAIAKFSKVALVSFSRWRMGKFKKLQRSGYQITETVVKPRIVISSAGDLARMPRISKRLKRIVSYPIRSRAPSKASLSFFTIRCGLGWPAGERLR
jgi:organic hydroperoxide reductase OsmC/OhrA